MYYFYTIRSLQDGSLYKGISINPQKRLLEHNSGKTNSTRNHIPYELVYTEVCTDRKEAREKEKYFKSGTGREKLKNLVK
jgi:putative endonuclease